VLAFGAPMRMRQSLAELEQAFVEEIEEDRYRRERLREEAVKRTRRRHAYRTKRRGSLRFALLVITLIATAVIVTIAMFQTLYYVMG
jgi:membrane glycosyltransferase